jgi:lysophospholipase L1-like esterase
MLPFDRCPDRAIAGGLATALALALLSCSSGGSTSAPDVDPDFGANDPSVVVAIGDSITFGYDGQYVLYCSESERYAGGFCPTLQDLTGKTVINEGVCGDDSYGGAARIESVLADHRPGVILIDFSPNDLYNGTDAVIRNLRSMITAARNNKTVPILGTLTPAVGAHDGWSPFIESLNEKILLLCAEQGIECADHFQAFTSDPRFISSPYALLASDGLHPNRAGYELMASTWRWPLLRSY